MKLFSHFPTLLPNSLLPFHFTRNVEWCRALSFLSVFAEWFRKIIHNNIVLRLIMAHMENILKDQILFDGHELRQPERINR